MQNKGCTSLRSKFVVSGLICSILLLFCTPVMAHHPFGAETPTNAVEGFLSGLGHPVIGLDHLAFIIASGFLAAIFNRGLLIPIAFVTTSLLGTVIHISSIDLPASEFFIATSVLAFGLILAIKNSLPSGVMVALAAVAGLFHGYAYGEAVVGARMSSLLAYLIGFSSIQMILSISAYSVAKRLGANHDEKSLNMRFAGFTFSGIGAAFLFSFVMG